MIRRTHVVLALVAATAVVALGVGSGVGTQDADITARLGDFDAYMQKILVDWNAPGIGVGIVIGDKLVFAKGYGYRDYGRRLPFTPTTLCQIASNTKLFTAVAAGLVVDEGKMTWDDPIRSSVPSIQFYNDQLNATITLRDWHHASRHDLVSVR